MVKSNVGLYDKIVVEDQKMRNRRIFLHKSSSKNRITNGFHSLLSPAGARGRAHIIYGIWRYFAG